jgi:cobalt-zinc-cadmium resistance protein CzcA
MLNAVIDWSLRNRFLVLIASALMAGLGLYFLSDLPIDAFPDTTPVQVQINTTAPALGPLEVERQITFPVEQAISGLPRLDQVRSLSRFGLSQVTVTFADGTDIYFARQLINERLAAVELPEGVNKPRMGPVATGLGEVFHYVVRTSRNDPMRARTLQDWTIRPALRTVPGTAEINSWGGLEKQYQVRISGQKLLSFGLTFDQVQEAIRRNHLDVGGGHVQRAGGMYLVRGLGRAYTVKEIKDILITTHRDGIPVTVGDVADVGVGPDVPLGGVTFKGEGAVVLGLGFMLMGENPHEVTSSLKKRKEQVEASLPDDVKVTTVYDRTQLVDHILQTVRGNLFEGGLLVIAVLFIFLGNLRAGLIVALAIPLSMLFAFSGMLRFGIAGSLLSLGAIDFGLIVDSSVVMIENCVRHLSHDPQDKRSRLEAIRDAAVEVRGPTMFGELIIMIVYLPILTLEGISGKLFRPMALTVIFALCGAMILSLTLMPVLASLLLPRRMDERDPWVVRAARWLYDPILRFALRNGAFVLSLALAALAAGVFLLVGLGKDFLPTLSEGAFVASILRIPGTNVQEAMRYNTLMEKALLKEFPDEVEYVWSRCGTAEVATDPMGPEETDMFITLHPRSGWTKATTQDELREKISKLFEEFPGQRVSIKQPIGQRIDEMISGVRGAVAVKIFGDEFKVLEERAEDVEKILRSIPGSTEVSTEVLSGLPMLEIKLRQDELARYGVSARSVLEKVETLGGKPVGDIVEGQRRFPLALRLPKGTREDPDKVAALLITTPTGEQVPLSRLAGVSLKEGPSQVKREWNKRRIVVQCNVTGRDVGSFVAEAQKRVEAEVAPKLPKERYRIEWGGEFENMQRARQRLTVVAPVALLLIFVLLYMTYHRLMDVVLVFAAVPFGSVGGLLALWLRDMSITLPAAVGFIALSGVSVLNSMVLVTFIRHLIGRGVEHDAAIEEAALTRLRPVLMTALVASLGFLPMALSTGVGAEVQRPLATVVIGGVISSTLMTLLLLPVLYHFFGTRTAAEAAAAGAVGPG